MKKTLIISVLFFLYHLTQAQTTGTMTDPRDGQTYKTISYKIKGGISMTWMAENLNYKTPESLRSGKKMGLFYNWQDAMKACPKG